MNRKEFKQLYDDMKALFPKDETVLTSASQELWYKCLKDTDYRRASEGLLLYARDKKWIPSIAEIVEYASKVPKYTQEEIHRMIEDAEKKEVEWLDQIGF